MVLTRSGQAGMLAVALCAAGSAVAKETKPPRKIDSRVEKIRAIALEGQTDRARKAVERAIERAPEQPRIVEPAALAQLLYLRGALALLSEDKKEQDVAPEVFRAALAVDPTLAWDPELLGEGDRWRFFEALRSEVGSRSPVPLGLPERHGRLVAFLDGRPVDPSSTALPGRHLAQVECPDGPVVGEWVTLPKPIKWLKLCPGRIDLDAAPAAPAPEDSDDDFGDFDVFGGTAPTEPPSEDDPTEDNPGGAPPTEAPPSEASGSAGAPDGDEAAP
jgi:hypothetical protein